MNSYLALISEEVVNGDKYNAGQLVSPVENSSVVNAKIW